MKKCFSLFAAFTLLICFAGCSANKLTDSDNNDTSVIEEQPQKTASELADVVLGSVEFPQTVNVTDEEQIEDMGIDLSYVTDYAVIQQMLSVDVVEVVILKVNEGSMEQAVESLQNRKESLIHDFAFYPGQIESTEATVVGSKGNIAYLICHKNAETAESKLLEEIG